MLPQVLLGVALVLGLYLLVRAFVSADPRTLAQAVRYGGVALGAGAVLLLVVTGRLGTALLIGTLLVPMVGRWRGLLAGVWGGRPSTATGAPPTTSRVETLYLRMTLEHETGAMTGTVLHGPFKGRALDTLALGQVLTLLEACRHEDEASVRVLEAWLDRTHPDWRRRSEETQSPRGGGMMTREEAHDILGLAEGATPAQIKDAHRRLMMKIHPDHGGSTYLAAKINEAKDLLLKT